MTKKEKERGIISRKKIKIYTKEMFKIFNIALISFGFIIAIVLIKYKPIYEVTVSGEQIGYTENKQALSEQIESDIINYSGENIQSVELKSDPEYELKLVEREQDTNESEIIIALQNELEITYKYYEVAQGEETVETVSTIENAEQIVNDIKELTDNEIELEIKEQTTENIEEVTTNTVEDAEANIIETLDIDTTEAITQIEGIKIACLPVTGTISSRYAESSSIRSSTHTGLDIAAPTGTEIKVVADGTVTFAEYKGSYGNLVETWYAHTSKINVSVGQEVKAGDIIALVGSTGNSTGSHLHFEVRINGQHVNPQKYLYN